MFFEVFLKFLLSGGQTLDPIGFSVARSRLRALFPMPEWLLMSKKDFKLFYIYRKICYPYIVFLCGLSVCVCVTLVASSGE